MDKVTIFGAGHVGATTAFYLALSATLEIALVDVADGLAQGLAMDIEQAMPYTGSGSRLQGGTDPGLAQGSDLVVITAGFPRTPGMSRLDLTARNAPVVEGIARAVAACAGDAVLMNVTNPIDEMTSLVWEASGFPPRRVLGMAGVLDTSRFMYFLDRLASVPARDVQAMVIGTHGDEMIPLRETSTVGGEPLSRAVEADLLAEIVERTQNGGAEIVGFLKTGSAYFAPAVAVGTMALAILGDTGRILPVSAYLDGEYGMEGLFVGVPARLGRAGVAEVVQIEIAKQELEELQQTASGIRQRVDEARKAGSNESD